MAYFKAVIAYLADANTQMQLSQSWVLNAPAREHQYLSQKWALQAGPRDSVLLVQVRYTCTLIKVGWPDLVLPMGSFQGTLKMAEWSWLSLIIPNGKHYAADIAAMLADGFPALMVVTRSGVQEDGVVKSDDIISVTLEEIRQDRGANNSSLSLSGHQTSGYTSDQKRIALEGVSYRADYSGKRRFRCRFDQELMPYDIAQIKATEEEIYVGEISYQVNPNVTVMEIVEA